MTPSIHRLAQIAALALIVCTLACASLSHLEPPEVTLVDLTMADITLFETTLQTKMRITNSNPEPLEVDGVSFVLYLEGKKVGRGNSAEVFTVGRLDSQVVEVTFHINNASALFRLREIMKKRTVDYGLKSTLFIPTAYGSRRLKAHHSGQLDLTGERIVDPPAELDERLL